MKKEYDVYLCRSKLTKEEEKRLSDPALKNWRYKMKPAFVAWSVKGEKK